MQGNPQSVIRFVLVAESLTRLMMLACARGWVTGLKVGATSPPIPILQFADDTLVFVEPSVVNIKNLIVVHVV